MIKTARFGEASGLVGVLCILQDGIEHSPICRKTGDAATEI
jgi:hypothetical protein